MLFRSIIVEGVKSDKGNISIGFYNNAATAFDPSSSVYGVHLPAKQGSVRHTFDIVPGSYAIGVIHDENGNGVLDYNFLGIPSEGYGFSCTATRKNYEKALVKIEKSGNIVIQLR